MKNNYFYLLLSGSLMLASCSQSHREQTSGSADSTSSYSSVSKESESTASAAKLIKTADMRFKVRNVRKSCTDISMLANSMSGMVMDHTLESFIEKSEKTPISGDSVIIVSSYSTHSNMVVRIPSEKMEDFLYAVGKLAIFVDAWNMHIDDKSLDYLSARMKSTSRSKFVKDQRKNAQAETGDATEVLHVNDDLIDHKVSNMKIDDSVKYSTISLNLYQNSLISKEVTANNNLSNYQLPFFTRMGNSFGYGWVLFKDFLIAITHIWIFIALGVCIWLAIRYKVRKSKAASHPKD